MSQEDHWKKAYKDLQESAQKSIDSIRASHREEIHAFEKRLQSVIAESDRRVNKANSLIDRLELVLHFTHDDIRTNLAEDTRKRIEGGIDEIRVHHGLKRKFA